MYNQSGPADSRNGDGVVAVQDFLESGSPDL